MNFFKHLYYRIALGNKQEKILKYMADRFEEWHRANCPTLSTEEALKRYGGVTIEEILQDIKW